LDEASFFLESCDLKERHIYGSREDSRCVGYYRRFIEGILKITEPMTKLLGKDKKFTWMPACEASFYEFKKRLTPALVLVMPDMEKSFLIYCDASDHRLGCVPMQDGHMVAYASW
jgi:hypothetical protein